MIRILFIFMNVCSTYHIIAPFIHGTGTGSSSIYVVATRSNVRRLNVSLQPI